MSANNLRYRPRSVSLYWAVKFLERLNPDKKTLKDKIKQTYGRYKVSKITQRMIAKFYSMKLKDNSKWKFFEKNVKYLSYIYYNKNELNYYKKTWIIDYMDFFVFRYKGEVFRKDGNAGFRDHLGRLVIKDFKGDLHLVEKIAYAAGKSPEYQLSYRTMKNQKIIFKDGNRENFIYTNLYSKNLIKQNPQNNEDFS